MEELIPETGKADEEQICAGGNLKIPLRHVNLYYK